MESATAKIKSVIDSFLSSEKKALKNYERIRNRNNKFALGRLVSTIAALAIVVGIADNLSANILFLSVFFSFIFFFILSKYHANLKKQEYSWEALSKSYRLSYLRLQRSFGELQQKSLPWSKKTRKIPHNHPYAIDLDVQTNLYVLLDTCSTAQGSARLLMYLLHGGLAPEPRDEVEKRSQRAQWLSKQTTLLRKIESLTLQQSFLEEYYKLSKLKPLKQKYKESFTLKYVLIFVSLALWFVAFIPALLSFLKTSRLEYLTQSTIAYCAVLVVLSFFFSSLVQKAEQYTLQLRILYLIVQECKEKLTQLPREIQFSFFEKAAVKKIRATLLILDLLSLRRNPVFWIAINCCLPFDALVFFFLSYQMKKIDYSIVAWLEDF
ncbi:MAG: hypothetical protein K2X39_08065, partial [Silvanigrellaceae bacterium]|nr:hypothetical protein [Silvanigrellaceae bacterium]